MSIPQFKSQADWQDFLNIFDDQFQCKKAMLDLVREELFPGYRWDTLPPRSVETINDIVSNLTYEVERQFKATHQDYRDEDDDIFIPYRSFKENVLEALNEALTPYDVGQKE